MTKNTIKQFIWGYQEHFRISVTSKFERLAEQIGITVMPDVFLVGIATKKKNELYVYVEPEEGHRYTQETFAPFRQEYEKARKSDPRAGMFQTHPVAQEIEDRRLHLRSICRSIIACIEAQDGGGGNVTFCSTPAKVGPFEVCVLIQVPQSQIDEYPSLVTAERRIGPYHVYSLTRSLIRAAAQVFLEECFDALWMPDVSYLECNVEDVAREAGRRMMSAPSTLGVIGDSLDSATLFAACNIISAARYEGASSLGDMLLSARKHTAVEAAIVFAHPIELHDHRGIRKLLELATDGRHLLSDGQTVYGVGTLNASYDPSSETVFRVRFTDHHKWELVHDSTTLMVVEYGNPHVPSLPFNVPKFKRDLPRFFPTIRDKDIERLCTIVLQACKQRHGTTVVIAADAQREAERLRGQATLIEPTCLTEDTVQMVTSIDGAILLDQQGVCYAIGVILDGMASPKGNPSRGGRYNSAVRYTEANPGTLSVVVSADATVDIVPDLRPQIPRRIVDDRLDKLASLAQQERVDPGDHNVVISQLRDVRFYLTVEDCRVANRLIEEIRAKIDFSDGGIIISNTEFKPHPEMNTSYYIPDD